MWEMSRPDTKCFVCVYAGRSLMLCGSQPCTSREAKPELGKLNRVDLAFSTLCPLSATCQFMRTLGSQTLIHLQRRLSSNGFDRRQTTTTYTMHG